MFLWYRRTMCCGRMPLKSLIARWQVPVLLTCRPFCLPSEQGTVHNDLHFGNIMVDADDRLWIIDCEDIGSSN
eukprot:3415995-Amphidinium_carterae.1